MITQKLIHTTAVCSILVLTLFASSVNALAIRVTDTSTGGAILTIFDGGAGDDDGLVNGVISANSLTVGLATVSSITATLTELNQMSSLMLSVQNAVSALANLFIDASHNGLGEAAASPSSSTLSFSTRAGSLSDPGTVVSAGFSDIANNLFASADIVDTVGVINDVSDMIFKTDNAVLADPFSLTILTDVTTGTTVSFESTLVAAASTVPAPPTILLLGASLLSMGFVVRRRKRGSSSTL